MKINLKSKHTKRIVSIITALAIFTAIMPINHTDKTNNSVITANAADEDYSDWNEVFPSNTPTVDQAEFAQYSRYYKNSPDFAQKHQYDSITVNTNGTWLLDDGFESLGTQTYHFAGTIYIPTITEETQLIVENKPLFNYVYDSVNIYKSSTTNVFPLEIIRMEDVQTGKNTPLFANHVEHNTENKPSAEWKIILSDKKETLSQIEYQNIHTYSGVIGEIGNGAEVNLEFKDNTSTRADFGQTGKDMGARVWSDTTDPVGILCGKISGNSTLKAKYLNSQPDKQVYISGNGSYVGGLIGSIEDNANFELLEGSENINIGISNSQNGYSGLICGYVKGNDTATPNIKLYDGVEIKGQVIGAKDAGSIVGRMEYGDIIFSTVNDGTVNFNNMTLSGTVNTGGAIGYFAPVNNSANAITNAKYKFTDCTFTSGNNGYSGGVIGEYVSVGGENIDVTGKYTFTNTTISGGTVGGIFGQYTANGDTTITGTVTPPESSVSFGGVIGNYNNLELSRTLDLNNLTVNNVTCTSTGDLVVGGVIKNVSGSSYITVNNVNVLNADVSTLSSPGKFGGIIGSSDNDSFLDITGNITVSTNGKYKGGAIAGSFKNGVVRFGGTTDISGATPENGYAQLIYQNDGSLVYALGSGQDDQWKLIRNSSAYVSDLGDNGEVVRLFGGQNAENANIVTVSESEHKVTLSAAPTDISTNVDFAKLALNMQLNDGTEHGALCFDDTTNSTREKLLDNTTTITINNKINLCGTGIIGLTRDGGKLYNGGFTDNLTFKGTLKGSGDNAEIVLAAGEPYGYVGNDNETGSDEKVRGWLYASHANNSDDFKNGSGHRLLGLFALAGNSAKIENLKVSGTINTAFNFINSGKLSTTDNRDSWVSPVVAYSDGNITFDKINTNVDINVDHSNTTVVNNIYNMDIYYIGGLIGKIKSASTTETTATISGCNVAVNVILNGANSALHHRLKFGGLTSMIDKNNETIKVIGSTFTPTVSFSDTTTPSSEDTFGYIAGLISYVVKQSENTTIDITDSSISGASLNTVSSKPSGFLGTIWLGTDVTINGLSIVKSELKVVKNDKALNIGGLVYNGSGRWDINGLTFGVDSKIINDTGKDIDSIGLIVNESYSTADSNGNSDGMYINLKNEKYTIAKGETGFTAPIGTVSDEIVAKSANNFGDKNIDAVLTNGNGTGIISINMNTNDETKTKITETGTYQNQYFTGSNISNSKSRYYYNLDVIEKNYNTATDGEKFLSWSVYKYAASNIKKHFNNNTNNNDTIKNLQDVDLIGLSYYPIDIGNETINLPSAIYTLDLDGVNSAENTNDSDGYQRESDGDSRNQHYLMHSGLFKNVTGTINTMGKITLTGNFGYFNNVMNGVLVGGTLTGEVNLSNGITFDGLTPSKVDSALLINEIDGKDTKTPKLNIKNLRAINYPSENTSAVASALINTAIGTNMNIVFSDIKLDARNGYENPDMTEAAETAMNNAYGTTRSIFSNATFFNKLSTDYTSTVEYNYKWDEDWGTDSDDNAKRNVTYAKEITDTIIYKDEIDTNLSGQNKYYGEKRWYTNPIDNTQRSDPFVFSTGFLPHIKEKFSTDTTTYPIYEVKVNYITVGLTKGCGTYNDPYIIDSESGGLLLNKVAKYLQNEGNMLDEVRLPNSTDTTWHDTTNGDALYKKDGDNYIKSDETVASKIWNKSSVREYLAGAYYKIVGDIILPDNFQGIGTGGTDENGEHIFHGVIVGQQTDGKNPTITNPTSNPFIKISNGSVIKNVDIKVDIDDTKKFPSFDIGNVGMSTIRFGYGRVAAEAAKYYGGVIGEIMGGDNVIDNVKVTYNNTTVTLSETKGNTVPVGGYVGVIVNGGLFFRNMPENADQTGLSVVNGDIELMDDTKTRAIYVNPIVGRVINGYAVNEGMNKLNNGTKHYSIDKIDKNEENKLDVSVDKKTIDIPNAQALFVLSLITQSTAGIADTANGSYNGNCFSYGMASSNNYLVGVTHQGDYNAVGAVGSDGNIVTEITANGDYSLRAVNDTANASATDRNNAVPYLIRNYTKGATVTSADARCVTKAGTYYNITLTGSTDYDLASNFPSFRGIGCVGNSNALYNMKLNTFEGNDNTIIIDIKHTRYGNTQDNYFYGCIRSTDPTNYASGIDTGFNGMDTDNYLPAQSHGIGLFDNVSSKDKNNRSKYQNFTLKGGSENGTTGVQELVYKADSDSCANNSQGIYAERFSAGGVLGFGYNNTYHDYNNITIDNLTVNCAYSSGGLVGLVANNKVDNIGIKVNKCQTGDKGITIIGGYHSAGQPRQGTGGLIGMNMKSGTEINTELTEEEKNNIYTVKIHEVTNDAPVNQTNHSNAGGIIGYGGVGVVINNMRVEGVDTESHIGDRNITTNSAGIVAYAQNKALTGDESRIILNRCSVKNINILANTNSGGFFSKSWTDGWAPSFCHFIDCSVSGDLSESDELQYGIKSGSYSGGFIADARAATKVAAGYSNMENCYINGYTISAANAGGMAGTVNAKPLHLINSYIEDCKIESTSVSGGFVSTLNEAVLGYNLKTKNVKFTNDESGQFIGSGNKNNIRLIGVAKYADDDKLEDIKDKDVYSGADNAFIVYADYTEQNKNDLSPAASTFNSDNNVIVPKSPYITVNPRGKMGTDEYITGDGAGQLDSAVSGYSDYTSGKATATQIYADATAENKSNRAYTNCPTDITTLKPYFESKKSADGFKISTWNTEIGAIVGVDDFTMLVIDKDDRDKTTEMINNYIRLVTNTYPTGDGYKQDTDKNNYKIVINPCKYDSGQKKFVLGDSADSSLIHDSDFYGWYYRMDISKADSSQGNQFTLIDVQFFDPTDTTKQNIAYHVYVPVYTKKTMGIEFKTASISGSTYKSDEYISKINREIEAGKNDRNPTTIVESTDTWITTYIRYEYPIAEINDMLKLNSDFKWNHNKQLMIRRTRESDIPNNTQLILINPNGNSDKAYYSKAGTFPSSNDQRVIDLSSFTDSSGNDYKEKTLYSLLDGKIEAETVESGGCYSEVNSEEEGAIAFTINGETKYYKYDSTNGTVSLTVSEPIYEDYYLSMSVPKNSSDAAYVVQVEPVNEMNVVDEGGNPLTTNIIRARVTSKLNSLLIIGDFFGHEIVSESFDVTTKGGGNVISEANKKLTVTTKSKIYFKNDENNKADYFLNNIKTSASIYHSFNISLLRYENGISDIIRGLSKSDIKATYIINDNTASDARVILASNYIQLMANDDAAFKSALTATNKDNNYTITVTGTAEMTFSDYKAEFPSNTEDLDNIGVKTSVRSNIAYNENDLPYSRMYATAEDTTFYYTKEQNNASLTFEAVEELDEEDIGEKTDNKSRLGINSKYQPNLKTINAKAVYTATDVTDYSDATSICYTIQLLKKTKGDDGITRYVQVDKISDYINSVILTDTGGDGKLEKNQALSTNNEYVYTFDINHDLPADNDKTFYTDFSCQVLSGEALTKKEFANYRIQITAELKGASNNLQRDYIVYTNAKIDPSVIPAS